MCHPVEGVGVWAVRQVHLLLLVLVVVWVTQPQRQHCCVPAAAGAPAASAPRRRPPGRHAAAVAAAVASAGPAAAPSRAWLPGRLPHAPHSLSGTCLQARQASVPAWQASVHARPGHHAHAVGSATAAQQQRNTDAVSHKVECKPDQCCWLLLSAGPAFSFSGSPPPGSPCPVLIHTQAQNATNVLPHPTPPAAPPLARPQSPQSCSSQTQCVTRGAPPLRPPAPAW